MLLKFKRVNLPDFCFPLRDQATERSRPVSAWYQSESRIWLAHSSLLFCESTALRHFHFSQIFLSLAFLLSFHILKSLQFRNSDHKTWFRKWVVKFDGLHAVFGNCQIARAIRDHVYKENWTFLTVSNHLSYSVVRQKPVASQEVWANGSWQQCFSDFIRLSRAKLAGRKLCLEKYL